MATSSVKPIRDGFHTITPYFFVRDIMRLIDFLTAAFDAVVIAQMKRPDGSVAHVEMRIGDSMLMAGEPMGDIAATAASIYLYVSDCDAVHAAALRAGGIAVAPVRTMPSGERYAGVADPCGNLWWIATHVEDVAPAEQERRWAEFFKNMQRGGS
jgi:uncharacterized glyoxalase superfamily protein PhnB